VRRLQRKACARRPWAIWTRLGRRFVVRSAREDGVPRRGDGMATRLGVDVGGTFTDLIFYDDETGEVGVAKDPTTPTAPQDGVIAAVRGSVASDRVQAAAYFLHGTTVGLNSL